MTASTTITDKRIMRQNITILVVDDQPDLRELLVKILSKEGYAVDTAVNGVDAQEKLRQKPYHLVLADVKMPGFNGLDLVKVIKREFPGTGAIVMTDYGDSYTVKEALLIGADEYITKPFKSFEINLVIERAYWRLVSAGEESPNR
ncbi:MAG: response regulator [candidate division Zixibacteria bacterium]|nr:response regulator [candidate division Zixibacteria bacterium]